MHGHASASGNPLAARRIQDGRFATLLARHGQNDRFLALQHIVVEIGRIHRGLCLARAGQHAHQAAKTAHALHLTELVGHILKVEFALAEFLRHALGLFGVHLLGGLLDQRDNIALSENPASHALGIEGIKAIELFADAHELDRQTRNGAHGKRRAAAAIAIHPCQDKAGQRQASMEAAGGFDGVLARKGISHEQRFRRVRDLRDLRHFIHHLLVDRRATGRIEDEDVIAADLRGVQGATGNISRQLALNDRQGADIFVALVGKDRELFHRGRTARIKRGEQDALAFLFRQALGELAGRGRLTGALQTSHHDNGRRAVDAQAGIGLFAAEHLDKAVINNLDDLLTGLDRTNDFLAHRAGAHAVDEILHDRQGDVRLEQGDPNLAQGRVHVLFGQCTATGQAVENSSKAFAQRVEHLCRSFAVCQMCLT